MYTLIFEPTVEGRRRYEMCFQAVAMAQKQLAVSEWDDCVSLIRALKSIGVEAREKIGSYHLYDLKDEGGTIFLERAEHRMLVDLVKQPIWRPLAIEEASELKTWLEAQKNGPRLTEIKGPQKEALN